MLQDEIKNPLNWFFDTFKPGGLDVWDQSRSRARTSIVWRLTFKNRRDFPSRRDWLFFGVEIESLDRDHVDTNWDP